VRDAEKDQNLHLPWQKLPLTAALSQFCKRWQLGVGRQSLLTTPFACMVPALSSFEWPEMVRTVH
jgi:hypothetical protein